MCSAELAIIISHTTSASAMIILLKTIKLLDLADFALESHHTMVQFLIIIIIHVISFQLLTFFNKCLISHVLYSSLKS